VVKTLCYNLEGCGLEIQWGEFFQYIILPAALCPLTEISTRNRKIMFPGSKMWLLCRADNFCRCLWAYCLDHVGSLTSHNPIGPPRPITILCIFVFLALRIVYCENVYTPLNNFHYMQNILIMLTLTIVFQKFAIYSNFQQPQKQCKQEIPLYKYCMLDI
jgi:hypothetical protein